MGSQDAQSDREQHPDNTLAVGAQADLDIFKSGGHYYLTGPQSAWKQLETAAKDMQGKAVEVPEDDDTVEISRNTLRSLLELVYMYRGDERVTHGADAKERFGVVHDAEESLQALTNKESR
ncbi:hypothetical protein [Haloarcula sp. Atlit-7R]|uniref:hypothetical protein n=1 Tax=Haloarcula sp. Atlit-7R TaxID=2282125 RepID=UPI000EF14BF5|nr:hypothetical protein [Haloarcula sp. Atlit-7R]RLM94390.1 hypothetical protein D3D01_16130 [Haloarcula sp. Atlit-7R]